MTLINAGVIHGSAQVAAAAAAAALPTASMQQRRHAQQLQAQTWRNAVALATRMQHGKGGGSDRNVTPAMDVFSLGCCFAELLTGGLHPFDHPQLLAFREGKYDPSSILARIDDPEARDLVAHMIQRDPAARLTAKGYLRKLLRTGYFPASFPTLMWFYVSLINPLEQASPDYKIAALKTSIHPMLERFFGAAAFAGGGGGGGSEGPRTQQPQQQGQGQTQGPSRPPSAAPSASASTATAAAPGGAGADGQGAVAADGAVVSPGSLPSSPVDAGAMALASADASAGAGAGAGAGAPQGLPHSADSAPLRRYIPALEELAGRLHRAAVAADGDGAAAAAFDPAAALALATPGDVASSGSGFGGAHTGVRGSSLLSPLIDEREVELALASFNVPDPFSQGYVKSAAHAAGATSSLTSSLALVASAGDDAAQDPRGYAVSALGPQSAVASSPAGGSSGQSLASTSTSTSSSINPVLPLLTLVCSCLGSLKLPTTKAIALDLIRILGGFVDDRTRVSRLVPYVLSVVTAGDLAAHARSVALHTLLALLKDVSDIDNDDVYLFSELVVPALTKLQAGDR